MDRFKHLILLDTITDCLITGEPAHADYIFPSSLDADGLGLYLGLEASDIFCELEPTDQEQLIQWYRIHGRIATELYGGILYHEWDRTTIAKRDVKSLFDANKPLYFDIVAKTIKKTFTIESTPTLNSCIEMCYDPTVFEVVLSDNVQLFLL